MGPRRARVEYSLCLPASTPMHHIAQVQGRNDNNWDQGQLFITQQGVYLAPAGMAQVGCRSCVALRVWGGSGSRGMPSLPLPSTTTHQVVLSNSTVTRRADAAVVAIESAGLLSAPQLDAVALYSASGMTLSLRVVNVAATASAVAVTAPDCVLPAAGASARIVTLSGALAAQNSPAQPLAVAPIAATVPAGAPSQPVSIAFTLPPYSFTIVDIACTATTAAAPVATTCDVPPPGAPLRLAWAGHGFAAFNSGPWATHDGAGGAASAPVLALPCDTFHCFDEAILTDATVQPGADGASWVAVNVSFPATPPLPPQGTQDAGLLVRCVLAGFGPGADGFSCYEVSLSPNVGGAPGSGFVLLGAHEAPGAHYAELARVPWDVPAGRPVPLRVDLAAAGAGGAVGFRVSVAGALALAHTDTAHATAINGGFVGVRAFYQDAEWAGLAAAPLVPAR